ncbi:hypothetical protein EJB05_08323, partial [Eragrostis curvula]
MASPEYNAMAELEEVLQRLGTADNLGLAEKEVARRLRLYGPNAVVLSHHYNVMVQIIRNSMSWMTVLTTVASLAITSAAQRSCKLAIIIFVLATSLIACFSSKLFLKYAKAPLESKAYAPRAKVLRDGRWRDVHAATLVPGDIIFLKVGDIVPANAHVLRFEKIVTMTCWAKRSVDCAHGFPIYYARTVFCGQGTAIVIATVRSIPRSTATLGTTLCSS